MENNEKLMNTHIVEWVYWDGEIQLNSFPVVWNKNIVINIHGTFGSLTGSNNKYWNFAEKLQEQNIASSVLYQSSRKNVPMDERLEDRYKQKQAKFIWKTFLDELEDARRVISSVINNSESEYWVPSNDLEITLNGNSLWGILAFYLANEFPQVKTISSVGTGLRLDIRDVPILDTFPSIDDLWPMLEGFKWNFLMQYGSEDDVFTKEAFKDLYKSVGSENKSFIHLLWVDHTFGKVGWDVSKTPYNEVFSHISQFIQSWNLPSWEHNLLWQVNKEVDEVKQVVDQALLDKYFVDDDEDDLNMNW